MEQESKKGHPADLSPDSVPKIVHAAEDAEGRNYLLSAVRFSAARGAEEEEDDYW